jgi:sugar phosphate isomerase/epimerase
MQPARYSLPTLNWLDFAREASRFSLERILDAAATAGFKSVGLDTVTTAGVAGIAELLHARGLTCTDVGILALGPNATADAELLAELAEASGATTCLVAWPAGFDGRRALEASADILAAAGVRVALEFFPYGALPTLESAVTECEVIGRERCGVLLDTWHFFRSGEPWALLRSLDSDQIAIIHANDAPAVISDDLVHESRHRRLPIGAGTFAVAEFVNTIDTLGYDGVISAEVLSSTLREQDPVEGAGTLMRALSEHWPIGRGPG